MNQAPTLKKQREGSRKRFRMFPQKKPPNKTHISYLYV